MIIHRDSFLQGYDLGLNEAARCEGFKNLDNTDWSPLPNKAIWNKFKATVITETLENEEDYLVLNDMYGQKWKIELTGDRTYPIVINILERK